jgi:hypothetical protein
VAVSSAPEEGSADDVVWGAGAPGRRLPGSRRAAGWLLGGCLVSGLLSCTPAGEALKQQAARSLDISLKPNGPVCGSLHCLDLLVVGSLDSS